MCTLLLRDEEWVLGYIRALSPAVDLNQYGNQTFECAAKWAEPLCLETGAVFASWPNLTRR